MTRKNKICDVIKEQFIYVKDENLKSALRFAFIDGVEWADQHPNLDSLWHDASEIPDIRDSILIQFAGGRCDVYIIQIKAQADLWHAWCKEYEVLRWAYVKDLLPKIK